jgi:hypothetical protein
VNKPLILKDEPNDRIAERLKRDTDELVAQSGDHIAASKRLLAATETPNEDPKPDPPAPRDDAQRKAPREALTVVDRVKRLNGLK